MANTDATCNSEGFVPIHQIDTTSETLTGRAGLALFSRYLRNLGLYAVLEKLFNSIRGSAKALHSGAAPPDPLLLFGWDQLLAGPI